MRVSSVHDIFTKHCTVHDETGYCIRGVPRVYTFNKKILIFLMAPFIDVAKEKKLYIFICLIYKAQTLSPSGYVAMFAIYRGLCYSGHVT